jgi:hypothetical protein
VEKDGNAGPMAPPYFGNELNAFNDGVQTALQFRLAFDFVKQMCAIEPARLDLEGAAEMVKQAYAIADELVTQGLRAGYVAPISDSNEVNSVTRKMIDRQVDAGLHQAKAQRRAQNEAMHGAVALPMPGHGLPS